MPSISDDDQRRLASACTDYQGERWLALSDAERAMLLNDPDVSAALKCKKVASRPYFPAGGVPLEDARIELSQAISGIFDHSPRLSEEYLSDPKRWEDEHPFSVGGVRTGMSCLLSPGRYVVRVDTGVGKTETYLRALAEKLGAAPSLQVVISAPTHKLCDEIKKRLEAIAGADCPTLVDASRPLAMVWAGLTSVIDNVQTCPMHKSVLAAMSAGRSRASLCKGAGSICNHHPDAGGNNPCRMETQRRSEPRVWIVPHAILSMKRPDAMPEHQLLVVDEAPFNSLMRDSGPKADDEGGVVRRKIELDKFLSARGEWRSIDPEIEWKLNKKLAALRQTHECGKLLTDDGYFRIQTLQECGIDAQVCIELADAERALRVNAENPISPNMSAGQIKKENQNAIAHNSLASTAADIWKAVADGLVVGGKTDRLRVVNGKVETNRPLPIHGTWLDGAEFLYCDATFRERIAECHLPDDHWILLRDIRVAPRNVTIRQVERSGSVRTFLEKHRDNEKDKQTARNNLAALLERIHFLAEHFSRQGGDSYDGLVMAQKELAEEIRRHLCEKGWARRIGICHFNGNRGIDLYGKVRFAICIGRTEPGLRAVGRLAGARFNYAPCEADEKWPTERRAIRMTSGAHPLIETSFHPDPWIDDTLRSICDDELMQTLGRTRLFCRTSESPLWIEMINKQVLDLDVHGLLKWNEYINEVGPLEKLALMGAVPQSMKSLKALGLFGSHDAARADSSVKGWKLPKTKNDVPWLPNADVIEVSFVEPGNRKRQKFFIDRNRISDPISFVMDRFNVALTGIRVG